MRAKLDEIDTRILTELQADASRSVAEMAEAVHLSPNACWKRIRRLEEAGVITARVALLDPAKLGLAVTVFVGVKAAEHSEEWFERFSRGVRAIPEVVEFYRMSGDLDYLLKILVPDIFGYDAVYKRLIAVTRLEDVSAAFAMEAIKRTHAVPLIYAGAG